MKIFTLSILLILFACKNNKDENQNEFNKQKENSKIELRLKNELIKNQNFALKKLNLKPISKLNSKTLRIWRFPGGGAIFEEIYELNIDEKELKLYSYLTKDVNAIESKELSKLEYQKVIENKELVEKLIKFSDEKSLLKFKNSEEYCENYFGCGDSFLVEYKNLSEQNTFSLNNGIKKCSNKNTEKPKELLYIIEKTISEYSN